jgi:catalase
MPAIEAVLTAKVAASYATLAYNSLHTFLLVDGDGVRTPVRFTWAPVAGVAHLDDPSDRDPDFLGQELADRLAAGAVGFDLVVHLGTEDDPTDDPTAVWPERPTVVAGRLELTAIDPDAEPIIFDPTNVPAGVELPPGDEILALRHLVYGHSYAARTA